MAKVSERRLVIKLRLQGKSYSEIKKVVPVSKSSLSLWLKSVPLSEKYKSHIKDIKAKTIEKFRETMRKKRDKRNKHYYKNQKAILLPLSNRDLLIAGLFLYWGEGGKTNRNQVTINNTDPSLVKFAMYWLINSLSVPKDKIKIQIHLYRDMEIEREIIFWQDYLKVNRNQFNKPYIKNSFKKDIDQKGWGHGTCGLVVCNTILKENILMGLKAVSDFYG